MNDEPPRWIYYSMAFVFIVVGLTLGLAELVAGRYLFCRRGGVGCVGELEIDAWFVLASFIHGALFIVPGLILARHLIRTRKR